MKPFLRPSSASVAASTTRMRSAVQITSPMKASVGWPVREQNASECTHEQHAGGTLRSTSRRHPASGQRHVGRGSRPEGGGRQDAAHVQLRAHSTS